MTLTLIAAVGPGGLIGTGDGLPWRLPADLAHFKRTTMGHALVMGRRTFESIGRPLPGRRTIVVTRDPTWRHAGVEVAHDVDEAIALAGPGEVFVAGGGEIYRLTMPRADRLLITEVEAPAAGSVYFPPIDPVQWVERDRTAVEDLVVVDYVRADGGDTGTPPG